MKTIFFRLTAIVCVLLFSGCSNGDDNLSFDYPLETLYGTWDGVALRTSSDDDWIYIPQYVDSKFEFGVKFNSDKTYYGFGYFGYGNGTYTARGKRITTYVDGKEYLYYDVKLLTSTEAEAIMRETGSDSTIGIKLKKR